ncbi:probable myosin-binding protein 4 [Neltuma alba]|uniref:probable myosin-binding protein 4 n=1 Tax=Neltuma alba TaxID=207710 RepID=UPI0010A42EA5|nr:probable myosin-binding protein 4 [Prosopis alba]
MVDMASSGTTFVKTQRIQGFSTVLTSAACEWFLLFLLLFNAVISYLSTKFARYCDLQTPCVLCSRIDHVISGEKQKLEWHQNLLCGDHRSQISSLVSCHIHDKVSDGHGMCDDCLMSLAPDDKTHSKTHRLLLGKLGTALGNHGSQSSLPTRDMFATSLGLKPCSCCGKFWNSMQSSQRSLLLKSPRITVFKPDFHLPDIYRKNCRNHHNSNLKKICDKPSCLGRCISDSMSNYAEYTEVKLASDSESEVAFSDDEDIGSRNHEHIEARNNLMPQFTAAAPSKCLPSDSNPTRPHGVSFETEPLILFPCVKPNVSSGSDVNSTVSDAVNDYGFGEIKWQQPNQESLTSELPELISLNEVSPSSDVVGASSQDPEGSKITCRSQNSLPAALSELVTSDTTHSMAGTSQKSDADDTQAILRKP